MYLLCECNFKQDIARILSPVPTSEFHLDEASVSFLNWNAEAATASEELILKHLLGTDPKTKPQSVSESLLLRIYSIKENPILLIEVWATWRWIECFFSQTCPGEIKKDGLVKSPVILQTPDPIANGLRSLPTIGLTQAAPGLSPIVRGKEIWNLLIYVAQLFEKLHTGWPAPGLTCRHL